MYEQPQTRPALALVPSRDFDARRLPVSTRLPASVYWFRRALAAGALLALLWASAFVASKLQWDLSPEALLTRQSTPDPGYVIMNDTALRVVPNGG